MQPKIYSFVAVRRHFFFNKSYNVDITEDQLKMTDVQSTNPKYVFDLNLNTVITWVIGKNPNQLRGFQFIYKGRKKEMLAPKDKLKQMMELISGRVVFDNLLSFYRPLFEIGKGSFSEVVLSDSLRDDQQYAIKIIKKERLLLNENNLQLFKNEVSILNHLKHQQRQIKLKDKIIQLHEVFQSEDSYYLVLDLVRGKTLDEEIQSFGSQEKIVNRNAIRSVLWQIAETLKALHDLGVNKNHQKYQIIHRDLKPENIMMTGQGNQKKIKLIDFGLATFSTREGCAFTRCGTPGYVAPEILNLRKGHHYNQAVDIFSFGAIFYEMLTGSALFQSKKGVEHLIKQNQKCRIDFNSVEMDEIQPKEKDLLIQMLHIDPIIRIKAEQILYHSYFDQHRLTLGEETMSALMQVKRLSSHFHQEPVPSEGQVQVQGGDNSVIQKSPKFIQQISIQYPPTPGVMPSSMLSNNDIKLSFYMKDKKGELKQEKVIYIKILKITQEKFSNVSLSPLFLMINKKNKGHDDHFILD